MKNSDGRLVVGGILIAVGLFLLLDNVVHFHFFIFDYIFSFPALLIIVGIIIVVNSRDNFFGYLLLIGGLYLFIKNELHMPINHYLNDLWPLAVIGFGLYLLLKRKGRRASHHHSEYRKEKGAQDHNNFTYSESDFIDETTILGSSNKSFSSQQFRGGKILTILAGSEIDLRGCKLGGERQIIEIVSIFGGTTIFLPPDWKVVISVVSIFGGFDDDRRPSTENEIDNEKILVIKGTVLFGGGELKS